MAVQEGPRNDNRFLMWAGHYSIRVMIPAILLIIAFTVTGQPGGQNGVLSWVVTAMWLLWWATLILDYGYHEERLCERCMGATPLDPQKAVNRWDWALRLAHAKKTMMVVTLFVLVWFFTSPWIAGHHLHWWGYVLSVAAFVTIGVIIGTTHVHRRLYPWCPYCRWGGRGKEDEVAPDPDPAASVS